MRTTTKLSKKFYLLVMMLTGILPAMAADFMVDSICYNIIGDNQVEVTSRDSVKYAGEVIIPATVFNDGITYQVTRIGKNAFQGCKELTLIDIPEGITSIGTFAFNGCTQLENVDLPNSLVTLETFAFYGCQSFTSFHVPRNLTEIAYNALMLCKNIAYYTCSSFNNKYKAVDGILYSKDLTMLVAYPFAATATSFDIPTTVTALHDYCLSGNNNLVAVNIPETVTWMGMNIFRDCQNIVEIDVPDGVTHMGITVFGGCTSLTRVHLPANLDTIRSSTFSGCTLLTEVTVPRNVSCIDEQGFINARSLKTVTFEEGSRLTSLGERAFMDCYALESLDLPSTVSSIGSGCFSSCRSLKTIHMPHNLTEIGSSIFTGCNSLTECEVIGDVPTMWNIFINCPKLKKVKLGDRNGTPGSTLIQNATITRCNQLEYLELGANIDSLENSALCSLDSLKVLICWATTPPRCHNYWSSFSPWPNELKNTVLYVPKASLEAYQTANDWKNFKTIVPIDDVGDVNGDGKLSIRDVNELINLLLSGENTDIATTFADVNLDGKISISDVTTLINRLLSGD